MNVQNNYFFNHDLDGSSFWKWSFPLAPCFDVCRQVWRDIDLCSYDGPFSNSCWRNLCCLIFRWYTRVKILAHDVFIDHWIITSNILYFSRRPMNYNHRILCCFWRVFSLHEDLKISHLPLHPRSLQYLNQIFCSCSNECIR